LQYFEPKKIRGKVFITPRRKLLQKVLPNGGHVWLVNSSTSRCHIFLVENAVISMWRQYGDVEVFSLENGMFIFQLQDGASCDDILDSRVWHVSNKPLIMRKWQLGMQILKLNLTSVPVWVKFCHLPMEFWTLTCLDYVASGIGKPLFADKVTEEQQRLVFAQVLIETDVHSDCPKELTLCSSNGEHVIVGVEYPWLPPKCSTCGNSGHAAFACAKKERKKRCGCLRVLEMDK
jgi:hypothetical protein